MHKPSLLAAIAAVLVANSDAFSLNPSVPTLRSTRSSHVSSVPHRAPILPSARRNAVVVERRGRSVPALRMAWEQPPYVAAKVGKNEDAADGLKKITVEVSAELAESYKVGGQYVMLKKDEAQEKPGFFAIASAPGAAPGAFEFLIKKTDGSAWFCDAAAGTDVLCTAAQGKGYKIAEQSGAKEVVALATGSGIAPIKALLESGAAKADKVRLYYGCRSKAAMAFQDLFAAWEKAGVTVIPVLSKPEGDWTGKTGYVQDALKADGIADPAATVVLLCGGNDFSKAAKEMLAEAGVPEERVLTNF